MRNIKNERSPRAYAKIAGLLYLVNAISGGFSMGYVPSVILASEDATATAQNIINNSGLFILGIIGDIIVTLLEIILTAMLYQLFKSVSRML